MELQTPQNPQNFFFNNFGKHLAEIKKENTLQLTLASIQPNSKLNIEQFRAVGELAYFVGLDFCNQTDYNPVVIDRFIKRFEALGITNLEIEKFKAVFAHITEDAIIDAKTQMKDMLEADVIVDLNERSDFMQFRNKVATVFYNSTYPVMFCEEIETIISKKHLNYNDILKINSLINEQLTITGKATKTLLQIFSLKIYAKVLTEAVSRLDQQKFAVVLFDSILSVVEGFKKFPDMFELLTSDETYNTIMDGCAKMAEIDAIAPTPVEPEAPKEIPAEIKEKLDNYPDLFIKNMFEETIGKPLETPEDLVEVLDVTSKNNDLVQHVYAFMKKKETENRMPFEEVYPTISVDRCAALLNGEIAALKETQRKMTVGLLETLPDKTQDKIVKLVNSTIESLMISDSKTKGYLLSQLMENQITTYKNLQQIVALIEECEILGGQAYETYLALVEYLKANTDAERIFIESESLSDVQLQLTFKMAATKFFFGSKSANETKE